MKACLALCPQEQLISCLTLRPTALTLAQGPPGPDFSNRGSVGPVPKLCSHLLLPLAVQG